MIVRRQTHISIEALMELLPALEITLEQEMTYRPDSPEYERRVKSVQDHAIGKGLGSSFTISRKAVGTIAQYNRDRLLSMFGSILRNEFGSYMNFVFDNGESALIGASPERHITVKDGAVVMNPISGTLRKSPQGVTREQLIAFLHDPKEINELFMVLDEELKLMAQMCERGGSVVGPQLLEMSKIMHTEYELVGHSDLDAMELYRRSMLAPTVTGSPMSSAPSVIARHEDESRRYYSGTINLLSHDARGVEALDAAISIRMAEVLNDGTMTLQAGATIVRDSIPSEEAKETEGKLAGMLNAILRSGNTPPVTQLPPLMDAEMRAILVERNIHLSDYLFYDQERTDRHIGELAGKIITVIDNKDDFCHMLKHMMMSMGATVRVVSFDEFDSDADASDIVVVGPGPGDPGDDHDPKMQKVAGITRRLLENDKRFVSVCLGHQILCRELGMDLACKDVPMQGIQKVIDLFGASERVGFYNTFVAHSKELDGIEQSTDPGTGDVYALRAKRFASFQFHPESILSQRGFDILSRTLKDLVRS